MTKKIKPKPRFLERMKCLLEDERDFKEYLRIIEMPLQNSIRCNTLKISPENLKKKLEEKDWKIKQPWKNNPEIMIVEGKYIRQGSQINTTSKSALPDFSVKKIINLEKNSKLAITDDNNLKNNLAINRISQRSIMAKPDTEQKISNEASEFKLINLEPGALGKSIEHRLGYYYVQELSSMLSIISLNPKEHEIILDVCSSPGSKTTQMASKMQNTGTIIANDKDFLRIKILSSNLEKCGVTNAIITHSDGAKLCKNLKGKFQFDKILLDAPCSGEGIIRSSNKARLIWKTKMIKSLSKLQKKLFKNAFELLKNGGEIVYSTCTHAPEENEEIVDFALKEFKGKIEIEKINLPVNCRLGIMNWNDKKYNQKVKNCCRIYPQDNNTEGFFLAKFKKIK